VLALAEFTAADLESGFPDLVYGELPLAALEVLQDCGGVAARQCLAAAQRSQRSSRWLLT